VVALSYEVEAEGVLSRSRVGRHASVATTRAISSFPLETTDELSARMIDMFKKPLDKMDYLSSQRFASDSAWHGMSWQAALNMASKEVTGGALCVCVGCVCRVPAVMQLCARVKTIFEKETRVLFLESPIYIFGQYSGGTIDLAEARR
jgi:hypothetical protein